MNDPSARIASLAEASALFLRDEEVRLGINLILQAATDLQRPLDDIAAQAGLGVAHMRAVLAIARTPSPTPSALIRALDISKQAVLRVLRDLESGGFLTVTPGRDDRRTRRLVLTDAGRALDAALFAAMRDPMRHAYRASGQDAVTGLWRVCRAIDAS